LGATTRGTTDVAKLLDAKAKMMENRFGYDLAKVPEEFGQLAGKAAS
jgi:hypothetical protein